MESSHDAEKPVSTFVDLLLDIFKVESHVLIKDIEEIDKQKESEEQKKSSSIESSNSSNIADFLPLAEIILSAHAAILIAGLACKIPDEMNIVRYGNKTNFINSITATFPRASWWLPIRVVKAFIVIQGKVSERKVLLTI